MPASASLCRPGTFGRAFVRVDEMQAHPQGVVFAEHPAEIGVIRCGNTAGIFVPIRTNSTWESPQPLKNPVEPLVA